MILETKTKEELIEYINKLNEENQHKLAQMEDMKLQLDKANLKINWYEGQFRLYQKQLFGSKSEKISPSQLSLFNEVEKESDLTLKEPVLIKEANEDTIKKPRKPKRSREVIYKDLPVERHEHHLEDQSCPQCHGQLHVIRQEVSKQLKVIPAQVVVVEDVYDICGCRNCEQIQIHTPIIKAESAKRAIPGSIASSSMISYVMEQKYVNSMPLYRQEQQFKRWGVELSRQNLANWMIKGAEWLEHLYNRMHELLVQNDILHADETTLQVLKEPGKAPSSKSYIWLYRTGRIGPAIVMYDYQSSREGKHPENFLKGFSGYLQVDGYKGYNNIPNVTLVSCWAHARRYFYEAIMSQPKKKKEGNPALTNAEQGFLFCSQLYEVEKEIKDLSPKERYTTRKNRSRPILDAFSTWLNQKTLEIVPKSKTGQAITYCLNQWSKLEGYLLDGRLEMDNNRAERSIKPFVIGRKNFLFSNTPKGAKTSAIIYSLVESAKENGLKPFQYITHLLNQLPNINLKNQEQLDSFLPWSKSIPNECK